jgi:hypothetical protein
LGEKNKYAFSISAAVALPHGVPYFPLKVTSVVYPFLFMVISLNEEWHAKRLVPEEMSRGMVVSLAAEHHQNESNTAIKNRNRNNARFILTDASASSGFPRIFSSYLQR